MALWKDRGDGLDDARCPAYDSAGRPCALPVGHEAEHASEEPPLPATNWWRVALIVGILTGVLMPYVALRG